MLKDRYFIEREKLINDPNSIIKIEKEFTKFLLQEVLIPSAENIFLDFSDRPKQLIPFWKNYPPEQRGRQPIGNSIPWLELGEKTTSSNLIAKLSSAIPEITFAGLPTGGDIRFTTENLFIHLDIKLTGPNDNPNEVVVPPNQVSGDGKIWNDGIMNSSHPIRYLTGKNKGAVNYNFQPKLPPIYFLDDKPLLCLTFFLETVYDVEEFGVHPLRHLELSCVPNGLLMFDTYNYANKEGFLIAGKDDNTKAEDTKRIRVRLNPLGEIANWRSTILSRNKNGSWVFKNRVTSE